VIGERVTLKLDLDSGAGTTIADQSQLEQVLANLIVNARDAMPHGGTLTVSTTRHLEPAGGNPTLERREWVLISVSDTGTGIPAGVRERIFEPFFTTKPRGQGTGLGLATSYGIVQQSGGIITVESAEGRGSTFRVFLPRTESKVEPETADITAPRDKKPGTVLVVEDQPALRAVARRVLEREGYVVYTAESGGEAKEVMAQLDTPPDAMVIDINLPDGDGREVMRVIGATYPSVAAILTSGAPETIRQIGEAIPLLEKPYSVASLSAAVATAIDSHRR
jgi:CheY-like chemotaxis protein